MLTRGARAAFRKLDTEYKEGAIWHPALGINGYIHLTFTVTNKHKNEDDDDDDDDNLLPRNPNEPRINNRKKT